MKGLKETLDRFYGEFNFPERLKVDPIEFPRRYYSHKDIEIAGFIASCFAYGRAELFRPFIGKLLSCMGGSPHDFLISFNPGRHRKFFKGMKYRFNENEDIIGFFYVLHKVVYKHNSLENVFNRYIGSGERSVEKGLSGLMSTCLAINTSSVYGSNVKPPGLRQLFPSPVHGSACKRPNLFLRWMIRDRDIDFGIWKGVRKENLVIPLDTHIARISRCLGLTERRSQDWKMALEITESLKRFDAEDPLKYDFALCHHGISGLCKGVKQRTACRRCIFNLHCS